MNNKSPAKIAAEKILHNIQSDPPVRRKITYEELIDELATYINEALTEERATAKDFKRMSFKAHAEQDRRFCQMASKLMARGYAFEFAEDDKYTIPDWLIKSAKRWESK